jgi:hypothetical protein
MTSFVASFIVFAVIGIAEIGPHAFWTHLLNPEVDGPAFDLLCATVAGTYGVALTVYFAGAATVAVTASDRGHRRRYEALVGALGSWWLFFPALFWYVAVNLIVGGAWGFPRFWGGILVLIGIGPFALVGFAKAAINVAKLITDDGFDATPTPDEDAEMVAEQPACATPIKHHADLPQARGSGKPRGERNE